MRTKSKNTKIQNAEHAITLLALIITVIILLILATISISLIINSGILDHAQHGVDRYSKEEKQEQIKLAVASARLKGNGFLTTENLNDELEKIFNDDIIIEEIYNGWKYKNYLIYNDGMIEENIEGELPSRYQQIEYIESTGRQYIDTNVMANQDTSSRVIFENTETTVYDNSYIIGAMLAWENKMHVITPYTVFGYNSRNVQSRSFRTPNVKFTAVLDKNRCELRNEQKSLLSATMQYSEFSPDLTLFIFACHLPKGAGCFYIGRIFGVTIVQNNINSRNYIPCYYKLNREAGLYDLVEGKFYTNQGEGTFLKGPDV